MNLSNLSGIRLSSFAKRLLLCLLPLVLIIIFRIFKLTNEADIKVIMRLGLIALAAYGIYLAYYRKLTADRVVTLIILAGIILRIGYTMYTGPFVRHHDIGAIDETGTGHYGYIFNIVQGHLPNSNDNQFYHPPLYYLVSGLFVKIAMILTGAGEVKNVMYMAQAVSCVASCVTIVVLAQIMDRLNIKKAIQIVILAATAVYPSQILAAGRVNNDALVLTFMVMALYFTLLWHKEQKLRYIIGIAITIGLGMMTKINCGMVALVTGPIMIYHFIKRLRSKKVADIKDIIIQLVVFGIICFPLGLWYPVRNYIMFNQPLNYVLDLGTDSFVYTGSKSFVERWLHIPFLHFMDTPYVNVGNDANVLMLLIKTGVHGEFKYENLSGFLAGTIDYVHTLLLILSVISVFVVCFKHKNMDKTQKYSALWVWILMLASYIQFNVAYPFSCTADFRYMLVWQIAAAMFIGYFMDFCYENRASRAAKYTFCVSVLVTGLFCALSVMHFC